MPRSQPQPALVDVRHFGEAVKRSVLEIVDDRIGANRPGDPKVDAVLVDLRRRITQIDLPDLLEAEEARRVFA